MLSKSSCKLQSLQPARRGAEGFVLEAELMQHADIQIAQRHGAGRDSEVLAVLETASGEQHRKVFVAVTVAAAEIGCDNDGGAVQQRGVAFLRILEICEQRVQFIKESVFDTFQLGDVALVLPVVGEVVIADVDARHSDGVLSEVTKCDDASAVGLEGEMGQVADTAQVGDDLVGRNGGLEFTWGSVAVNPFPRT